MSSQRRGPPQEEPAVPIKPAIAKARATYVRDMVAKINAMKADGKGQDEIYMEVSRFADDYPHLFKTVLAAESHESMASLRTMLAMLDKMGTNELSQHEASVIVGQRLHDTYIKPVLDS
jgi:hypothetical protein